MASLSRGEASDRSPQSVDPIPDPSTRGSFNPVFRAELEEISGRRRDAQFELPEFDLQNPSAELQGIIDELKDPEQERLWQESKTNGIVEPGLTGLALSGGGIRSSTFNFGVIQLLDRIGLFKHFDYLSTVSGGGYIGTYLSTCNLEDAKKGRANEFPFRHQAGVEEGSRIRHLRNYSSFLNPGGVQELLAIPVVLLRGIVINFLSLLPFLLLAAAILAVTVNTEYWQYGLYQDYEDYLAAEGGLFANQQLRLLLLSRFPVTIALTALLALSFALYPLFQRISVRMTRSPGYLQELREKTLRRFGVVLLVIAVAAFIELQPLVLEFFQKVSTNGWTAAAVGGSVFAVLFSDKVLTHLRGWIAKFGIVLFGLAGFILFWLILLWFALQMMSIGDQPAAWDLTVVAAIGVTVLVFCFSFVDVNFSSLHKYYRDKLTRAFVAQADSELRSEAIVPKLSMLDTSRGPYQLINVAVNVRRAEKKYQSGRKASFFFFAKRYCGGIRTSYCKTEKLELFAPNLDVGTAMAVSGAAVAPNMGKFTNPALTFIMAMLNLRLNYWLPNPRTFIKQETPRMYDRAYRFAGVGPFYLFAEMFRNLSEQHRYLNLSDGGHIENLGIYELLRRQCRLIVVGDGECDPTFTFQGLSEVIRMARIDFGFNVEMDGLDEIRSGEQRFAVGRIHYDSKREGRLIYLKSNLGGDYNLQASLKADDRYRTSPDRDDDYLFDNDVYVSHYRDNNPTFPNESTADQFFDEVQFESYRALGYQVAASALLAPWVRQNLTSEDTI